MKRPFETALYGTFRHLPDRSRISFLLAFFLLNIFLGWGQTGVEITSNEPDPTTNSPIPINISFEDGVDVLNDTDFTVNNGGLQDLLRGVPGYENFESLNVDDFTVIANLEDFLDSGYSFFDLSDEEKRAEYVVSKLAAVIVAIDIASNGDIYYLTYGNGVFRLGESDPIIDGDEFSTPLDLLIDNEDRILVADPENFRVRVYENSTFLFDIGGAKGKDGNEFYGPTGLAINEDNILYVADAFTGSDPEGLDQVKLYEITQSGANFQRRYGDAVLNDPYRIAVDKLNNVYVSDAGGDSDTGRVVVFDKDDALEKTVANSPTNSPGSIIVDEFGYLYMINYNGDLNFTDIYQNPEVLLSNFNQLSNSNYQIDVFTPFPELNKITSIYDNLNLPLDLALDNCGFLHALDMDFEGEVSGFIGDYPSDINVDFDFDIEKFKRQDNFTANIYPEDPGLVEVELSGLDLFKCGPQPDDYFSIMYDDGEEDLPPEFENCPESSIIIKTDDGECGAVVDIDIPTATDDDGNPVVTRVDNGPVSGDFFPVGTYTIISEADDGVNAPVECRFEIKVVDEENPIITCSEDLEFTIPAGESTVEVTYELPNVSDNCLVDYTLIAGPQSGSQQAEGAYTVVYEAEDASGNTSKCSFNIVVTQEAEPFAINCKDSYTVELGLNESAVSIPTEEFVNGDTSGIDFELNEQYFDCSDIGTFPLSINAKDSQTGETASCTVEVTVVDKGAPLLVCQAPTLQYSFPAGGSFEVPNLYENRVIDNCDDLEDLIIVQNPPVGTEWDEPGTYTVTYSARDTHDNFAECTVTIELSEEQGPFITCPNENDIAPIILDDNCDFEEPDYTSEVGTGNFTNSPTLNQSLQRVDNTLEVEIEVFDGQDYIGTCNFSVDIIDGSDPEIVCPANISKEIPSEETSAPINYTLPQVQDNCDNDPKLELIAGFESGEAFPLGSTTVTWRVTDDSGNQTECSFIVLISQEDGSNPTNSAPIANDDSYSVDQDDVLNKAAPGVLGNDTDAEDDALTASPVDNVQHGSLSLNPDGSFTYTPDPGYSGPDSFTYVANDGTANSNLATVSITVNSDNPGSDFQCKEEITLQLDQSGAASLQLTDLYTGDASGLNLVASQLDFTCAELGENTIELSWTGESSGSCEITVMVEDNIKPVAEVSFISVTLDANGLAEILPADLDSGSYDNCGELNFSLSKTRFTCEDTGQNTVAITLTDASGNSTTVNTIVFVNANPGTCNEPERDNDYLFLYPNPSNGLVKISPPWGVTVEQVFVFDKRGRFILSKDFDKSDLEYEFRLEGVQNAVYTLQILTSEGEIIRRLIIRN